MFQWSNNTNTSSSSSNPTTNRMRGQRTTVTAQSIQGTIRAPSEYTHAQHLDSYLQDETLKRSTRVVPPGKSAGTQKHTKRRVIDSHTHTHTHSHTTGNETFDTVFQSVQGDTFILRIHFAESNYPQMSLAGMEATHSWLDRQGLIVGYPPIQSATAWRDSRLLLGQAVHQVVQELQVHPPVIHRITDPALERIQRKRQGTMHHHDDASHTQQREDDAPPTYSSVVNNPTVEMPKVPTEFPELDALDREELDRLLTDDIEFQAFCHGLDVVKTLIQMTASVVDENAKLARRNLEKEEQLKELYQKAKYLQEQLRKKVEEFRLLEQKQDKLCNPVDSRKLIKDLTKAKKEAFDESEQLADDWIENQGGAQVDEFLSKFLGIRKLHHVRAAKLELLEASR